MSYLILRHIDKSHLGRQIYELIGIWGIEVSAGHVVKKFVVVGTLIAAYVATGVLGPLP